MPCPECGPSSEPTIVDACLDEVCPQCGLVVRESAEFASDLKTDQRERADYEDLGLGGKIGTWSHWSLARAAHIANAGSLSVTGKKRKNASRVADDELLEKMCKTLGMSQAIAENAAFIHERYEQHNPPRMRGENKQALFAAFAYVAMQDAGLTLILDAFCARAGVNRRRLIKGMKMVTVAVPSRCSAKICTHDADSVVDLFDVVQAIKIKVRALYDEVLARDSLNKNISLPLLVGACLYVVCDGELSAADVSKTLRINPTTLSKLASALSSR